MSKQTVTTKNGGPPKITRASRAKSGADRIQNINPEQVATPSADAPTLYGVPTPIMGSGLNPSAPPANSNAQADEAERRRLAEETQRAQALAQQEQERRRETLIIAANAQLSVPFVNFNAEESRRLITALNDFSSNIEARTVQTKLSRRSMEFNTLRSDMGPMSKTSVERLLEGVQPTEDEISTEDLKQIRSRLSQGVHTDAYTANKDEVRRIISKMDDLLAQRREEAEARARAERPTPEPAPAPAPQTDTKTAPSWGSRILSALVIILGLLILIAVLIGIWKVLVPMLNLRRSQEALQDIHHVVTTHREAVTSGRTGATPASGSNSGASQSTPPAVPAAPALSTPSPTCVPLCQRSGSNCDDRPGHPDDLNCCRRIRGGEFSNDPSNGTNSSIERIICENYNTVNQSIDDPVATGTYDWSACQFCPVGATATP